VKKEEMITIDEAVLRTVKHLHCSRAEARRMIIEATLKGELPAYKELDDGFMRLTPVDELAKK
jgi:hypothetical protein